MGLLDSIKETASAIFSKPSEADIVAAERREDLKNDPTTPKHEIGDDLYVDGETGKHYQRGETRIEEDHGGLTLDKYEDNLWASQQKPEEQEDTPN